MIDFLKFIAVLTGALAVVFHLDVSPLVSLFLVVATAASYIYLQLLCGIKCWYNYRVSNWAGSYVCERKMKIVGCFWDTMFYNGITPNVYPTREDAESQLRFFLSSED